MNFHFDVLAPLYEKVIGAPDWANLHAILALPAPSARLLDCGGGTGRVAKGLQPLVGQLVLADYSRGMLRQAPTSLHRTQANVLALPYPTNSFDRILVVDSLHHFPQPEQALGELARVLKPGGRLVIEELDIQFGVTRFVNIVERMVLMTSRFLPPATICAVLTQHGLACQVAHRQAAYATILGEK